MNDLNEIRNSFIKEVATSLRVLARDTPSNKSVLANLRKLSNVSVEDAQSAWPVLYQNRENGFPESISNKLDSAFLTILNAFSIHVRSNPEAYKTKTEGGHTVGGLLRSMRKTQSNPEAFDKKVSAIFSEDTYSDLTYRLTTLLRQQKTVSLDYPKLAWELYLLQTSRRKNVILQWGKDYYSVTPSSQLQKEKV